MITPERVKLGPHNNFTAQIYIYTYIHTYIRNSPIKIHRLKGQNFPVFISCRCLVELVTIHFSLFTCSIGSFGIHSRACSASRTPNSHNHSYVHPSFTPITRVVATKVSRDHHANKATPRIWERSYWLEKGTHTHLSPRLVKQVSANQGQKQLRYVCSICAVSCCCLCIHHDCGMFSLCWAVI